MAKATVEITDRNFEQEVGGAGLPVLVDFWAEWCAPCRIVGPVVDEIATDYAGRAKIGKVNVDENDELTRRFHILSIPTLVFFKDGQVHSQLVGVRSKKELATVLDSILNG